MDDKIETFLNYLLDTEATSEVVFNENIHENNELFDSKYLNIWESLVNQKIQKVYLNTNVSTLNYVPTSEESESDESEEKEKEDDDNDQEEKEDDDNDQEEIENDDDDQEEKELAKETKKDEENKIFRRVNSIHPDKSIEYVDVVQQCHRLLQLLRCCQQHYKHFVDLYFKSLDQCIKHENEKIVGVALQQIASHLSENVNDNDERKRLIHCLPTDLSNSTIRILHQPLFETIQSLLSTNNPEQTMISLDSLDDIDILYPYTARYLDVRREFRDSIHYFIDGDSLILSIAHHINVDLISYYGNTLHVIYIIERILLTLYNQSYQCNYTLLFFDCHHKLYEQEKSILTLLRSCLIVHLSKNADKCGPRRIKQFSSWIDNDYVQFARDEKPLFMFYHDMTSLDTNNDSLLSENTLKKLRIVYRLFGNYHQYDHKCHLYLMNKLTLRETTIQCFEIQFNRQFPLNLLEKISELVPNKPLNIIQEQKTEYKRFCDNDIRLYLYLKTILKFYEKTEEQDLLYPLLILHVALLIRLSLLDRHLPSSFATITFNPILSQMITQFQQGLSSYLFSQVSLLSWSKVADLFDGRLFAFTLYQLSSLSNIRFDSQTYEIVKEILSILNISFNDNLFQNIINKMIQQNLIEIKSSVLVPQIETRQNITKISNPFIDTLLQPILTSNNLSTIEWEIPIDTEATRYQGMHHWHTYQEVGNEVERIHDGNEFIKRRRKNRRYREQKKQHYYTYFTLYGKSLTSPDVKRNQLQIFLPNTSISRSDNGNRSLERSYSPSSASSGRPKQRHLNQPNKRRIKSEVRIRNNINEQKEKETLAAETTRIKEMKDKFKEISLGDYSDTITRIDNVLSKTETPKNRWKLLKLKLEQQRKYIRSLKTNNQLTKEEKFKLESLQIELFAAISEIVNLKIDKDPLQNKQEYMEELIDDLPFEQEKWYRFQMKKINSRLPRHEKGIPDIRAEGFIPDRWQLNFLNAVDNDESIIIVAPTAAGKTYASYYAMKRILKDVNYPKGICVYVAPTKALVNQVAATIYSKLGTDFGLFTRDYRVRVQECRILVTVPHCLEILLLSPTYQEWCQRIRCCIFDEIHCMSGELGSDVWEKTMLLINCPMIGLSATVNNGGNLCQWIKHVEQRRSNLYGTSRPREVRYILHKERLADLNKYLYSNKQLHPIHPCSLMNSKQIGSRGLPKDFSLSPNETLQFKDAMQNVLNTTEGLSSEERSIPTLNEYFSPDLIIERRKCNEYSTILSNKFKDLIKKQQNLTIDSIAHSLNTINTDNFSYPEQRSITKVIVDFVLTLQEKDLLPCILFMDSRRLCEKLAESVTQYFEELEDKLRQTKYKKQIQRLEKREEDYEKMIRATSKNRQIKSTETEEVEVHCKLSGHEEKLLYGILDECTLVNHGRYNEEIVSKLREQALKYNERLVRYMDRGVAYHHAELNNKQRISVEGLYRSRYVQIIFSTSTLAMGIHMPTKTVAFVKDSIFLDALQYRQSSGRAGRRGFDIEGHIVFINIPISKIRHLTISAIPDIHSHFPTSVTFFMRLLHLYSNAKDKKDAMNRSLIALECPFIKQSPNKQLLIDLQTRYHCLYTLDFLYQLNLINSNGDLIGLAGLLTHLHYFEPSNILLVYLMNTKLFHRLNNNMDIVNVLARIFTKIPWLLTYQQYENLKLKRREQMFNSKLFLSTQLTEFNEAVFKYNSIVKDIYGFYIENVIKNLRSVNNNQEQILPFSNKSFVQLSDYDNGTFEYNLHHHDSQQLLNLSISPFASPSGLTHEKFMLNYNPTIGSWDLAYDIDLSARIVPFVDINARDHTNSSYYLNSYALDFFNHGSEISLIEENQINSGDTNNLLFDYSLMLSSITTSLKVIIDNKNKQTAIDDIQFFTPLYEKISNIKDIFADKFYKAYPYTKKNF